MRLVTPLAERMPSHGEEFQAECLDALKDNMQARLVEGSA